MPLRASLGPRIAGWTRDGALGEAAGTLARSWTFALLLAVPVAVGGILLAEPLLYFLYGAAFAPAAPALAFLLLAQLVSVGSLLEGMALSAVGRPRGAFVAAGAGAAALVLGDIVLIPAFGITGAAMALLASTAVATVLARVLLGRTVRVRLERRPIGAITLGAALMAGTVLAYRVVLPPDSLPILIGAVVLGAAVYFGAVLGFDPTIRAEIDGIMRAIL
jgi:O-antigen/teichoic acid export membrane protein